MKSMQAVYKMFIQWKNGKSICYVCVQMGIEKSHISESRVRGVAAHSDNLRQ